MPHPLTDSCSSIAVRATEPGNRVPGRISSTVSWCAAYGLPRRDGLSQFTGPAGCFDSQADALTALSQGTISEGTVVVLRGLGPRARPGMGKASQITSTPPGRSAT